MSRSKKPLAVSFVLTLAACDARPAAAPLVEAGDAATATSTTTATTTTTTTTTASATASATATATATAEPPRVAPDAGAAALPPAPNGGTVTKNADGTCMWAPPPSRCPPHISCNPPAPHAVACPK